MADNVINNLAIEVTASAENATKVFDRLASSAGRVRGAANSASGGLQNMATGAKDAGMATAEAGEASGSATPKIRGVGNAAHDAGEKAKKGAHGLANFWQSLKRIAYYRFIRTIIKEIGEAISTGIKNLYHWSDAINGHFASSMDRLATSSQYLKNSFGAMVSPLIESFIPVLDVIIDKVVDVLNFFNMLVSAISGADTYTVAKKAAAVWDDSATKTKQSAKSAADDIKRTILGFDEINKLVKPNSSSGGSGSTSGKTQPNYSDMFEERPLTGIFKKISNVTSGLPDWLKWLLGIGTVAGAAWGITQIPKLLKRIFDGMKNLIGLHIPNWLNNLFGGRGGGGGADGNGNYDIGVDLKKGNWDVLDDLKDESALVKVGLQHWGWDNIDDWIGNAVTVGVGLKKWAWKSLSDWIGDSVLVKVTLMHWGWDNILDWIGNVVSVGVGLRKWGWNSLSGFIGDSVIVKVSLMHWGWDNIGDWIGRATTVWIGLNKMGWESISEFIGTEALVGISLFKEKWDSISEWVGNHVDVSVALKKLGWTTIKKWIGYQNVVWISLEKSGWTTIYDWIGTRNVVEISLARSGWRTIDEYIGTSVTVKISLQRYGWDTIAKWVGTLVSVGISLFKTNFYDIRDFVGNYVNVAIYLHRGDWYSLAWWMGDWVDVYIYLQRGNFWSLSDWLGTSVTVGVYLRYAGGGYITSSGSGSFGSATGGGGRTSGGGITRSRHANGGVITSTSESWWNSVPKFAGGTSGYHGTMFLAGEAGPEIVGHVGGRTEVLNKSQLASTMFDAVQSAMAPVAMNFAAAANYIYGAVGNGSNESTDMLIDLLRRCTETIERQDQLIAEQNDYLRQINEKEFTAEVTTSSIVRGMTRTNRRAGTTVVSVGG